MRWNQQNRQQTRRVSLLSLADGINTVEGDVRICDGSNQCCLDFSKNLVPPATRHGRTSSFSKENRVTDEPSRIEPRSIQQTVSY